jgi:hypothetical protein
MTLSTYAHLFDEFEGAERRLAEPRFAALVTASSEAGVPSCTAEPATSVDQSLERPANLVKPTRGFEPRTPSLRVKRV